MTIVFNGQPREAEEDTTIAGLLESLDLPVQRVAVEVNMELVPRERHQEYLLQDGDVIEVVTLVGGG